MTKIRAELSKSNPLYVDKHAFLSAYHFALQYPVWKRQYADTIGSAVKAVDPDGMPHGSETGDPTSRIAMRASVLRSNIDLIESTALIAGEGLAEYILYATTNEGVTYRYHTLQLSGQDTYPTVLLSALEANGGTQCHELML